MNANHSLLGLAVASALAAPTPLLAQSTEAQLEEIVVTAQRREEQIQNVPVAITAFSGEDIAALGFTQMQDLATQTPNVQIKNVIANSIPNVTIRGVGLNDYAANNNPAAGIYVDDVYLVSPAMLNFQMFDVERVEVLKGPQGTLFGRNTTAGTINFHSRRPGDTFEARASLDYGRYQYLNFEGAVGGPLGENFGARLAVQTVQQGEGWQTNRLNGAKVGEVDRTAARLLLSWQPSDAVDVLLNLHGGRDRSDTLLVKIDNPFSTEDDRDADPYRSGASIDPRMELDARGASLTIDWSISDVLSLTSVTATERFERFHQEDRDGIRLEQLDGIFANDIEQFSQEVRLTYVGQDLVLIGGAFYGTDEVDTRDRFDAPDLLGLLGLAGVRSLGNEYTQETTSAAAFLHSEWKFAPAWRLTAGARYTDDRKEFRDAFTYLIAGGVENRLFPPVSNDFDTQDVSGRLALDFTGFEDTLLYASVSRGFKSGGFQGQLTFNPADLQPFEDETLLAYELGFKSRLAGNTVQLNGAAFFYDYSDLQFYGGLFDSPVGVLFGITNVGDAEVRGAELDLWWRPAAGLDLRLGLGLLDTEVTRSIVAGVATGSELPNAPEVTGNALLRYQWPVGDGLRASVLLAGNYQGDLSFDVVRDPRETRESGYFLADARIGIGAADERWTASLWVKNLADERYRTQVLFSSVGFGSNFGPPRTYGIGLTFKL
ncbi:MAG: TonB-dependent receptor [Steroidobacteraceae bacterium]|jgi:iron complex outermembrane receptor protein|nr:TonB-dependent receptor [Steroidobacteraceae bacterium]